MAKDFNAKPTGNTSYGSPRFRNSSSSVGGDPQMLSVSQNVPPGGGFVEPTIPVEGELDGRSVYYLLYNVWDPRAVQNADYELEDFGQRYSMYSYGFDYMNTCIDYLYRIVFGTRPGRNEPRLTDIGGVIDTLVDISRMLGIYYTALTMKQSRDPLMFQRAQALNLRDTLAEMQTILMDLPCPSFLVRLNAKYVRLMDVSSDQMYQNVGFLAVGDYDAFLTLYDTVRRRRMALSIMRQMLGYPVIGNLGDPGSAFDPDVMQAFSNANYKAPGTDPYCPYVTCQGSTLEVPQLASAGVLHTVFTDDRIYCQTGWVLPGTGFTFNSSTIDPQRIPYPYVCVWNPANGVDAAISRTTVEASAQLGVIWRPATIANADLAANIAHEYNFARTDTLSAACVTSFDPDSPAVLSSESLALEDTRYRASAGFSLQKLSYAFNANNMAFLAGLLSDNRNLI